MDAYSDDDDYDYGHRRHRQAAPHRGTAVLVLGILSLVLCAPLGIAAWIMGSNDLAAMESGRMDRSGEGLTRAGQVLGIIGSIMLILSCFGFGFVGLTHVMR